MQPSVGAILLAFGLLVVLELSYWVYKRDPGVDRRVVSCS